MMRHRVLLLVLLAIVHPSAATASDDARFRHIRSTDRRLRSLLVEGARTSPTFRALVERIERSDLVVYLVCEGSPRDRIAGRLTFVSAAAGVRYVAIRVARLPRPQQIAILGHEFQHAVEIADHASIVDDVSLAHVYERIGVPTDSAGRTRLTFDTQAAINAGQQVLVEIGGKNPNSQLPTPNSQATAGD